MSKSITLDNSGKTFTKQAALTLRAINHKLRQVIIKTIDEAGKITVTQLYVKLRLEQSVCSQHLAILRKAGIVTTAREGKFIYYSVNNERILKLVLLAQQICEI